MKPIVPSSGSIEQAPGSEFLHISVRFLDGSFITGLEKDYLLRAPISHGTIPTAQLSNLSLFAPSTVTQSVTSSGLPMRRAQTCLPRSFRRCWAPVRRSPERRIALLYLDLDRFKQVNDSLGHPAGDELIREVGRRLKAVVRECDTVARIGGDEFAVIQTEVHTPADTEVLCKRIIERMKMPFDLLQNQVFVGVTIGVAVAPSDALDRIELTRKADIALYSAKTAGRGRYVLFAETMDVSLRQRRATERDLRAAMLAGNQLKVHYQPLYSAGSGEITGLEALVRWQHPKDGFKSPALFIPVAEESGLIEQLGEWVLREACTAAARWPVPKIAVNVSAVQLRNPNFALRVMSILQETGLQPQRLELEVTETALIESAEQCGPNIKMLRGAGVQVALDDFGTGYSSLSHLRKFQVDRVKIDRSFVSGIDREDDSNAIIQAIVDLAQATGLKVTAEGVETQSQSNFLSGIGCNELQGFLLSRPMSSEQVDHLFGIPERRSQSELAA